MWRQDAHLARLRDTIAHDLGCGLALSEALARHPAVFDQDDVAALRYGEEQGRAEATLLAVYQQSRLGHDLRERLRAFLAYPAATLTVMWVSAAMVTFKALPAFADPDSARLAIGWRAADMVALALSAAAVIGLILRDRWRRPSARPTLEALLLRLPLIGRLWGSLHQIYLYRTVFAALAAGVRPDAVLEAAAATLPSSIYRERARTAADDVGRGVAVADVLRSSQLLPTFPAWLLAAAPFDRMATLVDDLVASEERTIRLLRARIVVWIEVVCLVALGLIAAAVASAVYLTLADVGRVRL